MKDITSYLIVVTASLGIAYCLYRLFFRNEMRFSIQRVFLLGTLAISVLLPLTQISIDIRGMSTDTTRVADAASFPGIMSIQPAPDEKGLIRQLIDQLPYIYFIVSTLFILTLVIHLIRILHLYRSSKKARQGEITILTSEKIESPFSFFHWVFVPAAIPEDDELRSIIIHERVHARNFHSIDNLILELLTAFMWFNPFLWMMKKSLHLVHEYLADEGALEAGVERTTYQAHLINQVAEEKLIYLNSGFYNNLKQRMIMMTKSKNRGKKSPRMLTMVPLSVILVAAVAVLNGLFIRDVNASDLNQEQKKNKNKEIVVTGYSDQKLNESMNYIVDGVSMENIDNLSPDSIESVNVLKTDRTIVIRTKAYARKNPPELKTTVNTGSDKVLYIKDGEVISKEDMESINPSDIEKIDVIKRKETIQKYTDYKDFDGVILITTKK